MHGIGARRGRRTREWCVLNSLLSQPLSLLNSVKDNCLTQSFLFIAWNCFGCFYLYTFFHLFDFSAFWRETPLEVMFGALGWTQQIINEFMDELSSILYKIFMHLKLYPRPDFRRQKPAGKKGPFWPLALPTACKDCMVCVKSWYGAFQTQNLPN